MSNKLRSLQNLLTLSAATLIITVWATVSFLAYQNIFHKKYSVKYTSNLPNKLSPSLTPTIPINETPNLTENIINKGLYKNWVEFIDYNNGYSIKYPPSVYTRQNCIGEALLLQLKESSPPLSKSHMCNRDYPYSLEIMIKTEPGTNPYTNKYYKVNINKIEINGISENIYTSNLISVSDSFGMDSIKWFQEVHLENNGRYYKLYFQDKENEKLFNQILSTFRFTK